MVLLHPKKVLERLREAMAPEDLVVSDVGAHKIWIDRFFPAPPAAGPQGTVVLSVSPCQTRRSGERRAK